MAIQQSERVRIMIEQTTIRAGGSNADLAAAHEPPASGCCGTASASAKPAEAAQPCCGTAQEAGDADSCCGHEAKAVSVAAGAGCCG